MSSYALLHIQSGLSQNASLIGGIFYYPLKTDDERAKYRRAMDHIAEHKAWLHTRWTLMTEEQHEEAVRMYRDTSGIQLEPITLPQGIAHGSLHYNIYFRFDGYTFAQKDQLIAQLFESGFRPRHEALDFMWTHRFKELDSLGIPIDRALLEGEQKSALSKEVSFYTEELV